MNQYFLFLELRDSEICTLLHGLRFSFTGRPSQTNIHMTVRGPYAKPLKQVQIEPFRVALSRDVLRISGVGMFENPDGIVVYLNVNSDNLKKIWWKRDYPKGKYGFNPHISLYRGSDKDLAARVYDFLKEENLDLQCCDYELTPYVSNQFCLLSGARRRLDKHFLRLILKGKVRGDILERAVALRCQLEFVK